MAAGDTMNNMLTDPNTGLPIIQNPTQKNPLSPPGSSTATSGTIGGAYTPALPGQPSTGSTTQTSKATAPPPFVPTGNIQGQITPSVAQAQDASNGGVGIDNNGSAGTYSFQIPAGIDPSNPTDKFVLDHFQKYISRANAGDPGAQPTAQNMDYWIDKINQGGGPSAYWDSRMTPGDPSNDAPAGGSSGSGATSLSMGDLMQGMLAPISLGYNTYGPSGGTQQGNPNFNMQTGGVPGADPNDPFLSLSITGGLKNGPLPTPMPIPGANTGSIGGIASTSPTTAQAAALMQQLLAQRK